MRRGDIYLADLEPSRGSEANKTRPVIIVSHNALNQIVEERRRGVVTVVPLSSNTDAVYAFQVFLPAEVTGLSRDSKAQATNCSLVWMLSRFKCKSTFEGG